jgi:hypothetical protein
MGLKVTVFALVMAFSAMAQADMTFLKSGVVCGLGPIFLNEKLAGFQYVNEKWVKNDYIVIGGSTLAVKLPVSVSAPTSYIVDGVANLCVTATSLQK